MHSIENRKRERTSQDDLHDLKRGRRTLIRAKNFFKILSVVRHRLTNLELFIFVNDVGGVSKRV